jgi:isopenicillin-N N-acyltransferase-like protein
MQLGTVQGIPHIRVGGAPDSRGYALGASAADRVRKSIENYTETFDHYTGLGWDAVCDRAEAFLPAIEAYDSEIAEEMRGIARGAGADLREILAINVRTEVMYGLSATVKPECTAFGAERQLSPDGHVVIGQNWDWRPVCREACILLEVEQPGKPSFITFLEAGLVGKMGFNSSGLGMACNLLVTDLDRGEIGVPFHVVLRGILNSTSLAGAVDAITRAPRAASANYLIATDAGEIQNFETGPGGRETVFALSPADGLLTHANSFVSGIGSVKDVGVEKLPDSPARTVRLQKLLASRGAVGVEEVKQALVDHDGYPGSICRHLNTEEHPIEQIATNASLIMDLTARELQVAVGPPCEGPYETVTPGFVRETEAALSHRG